MTFWDEYSTTVIQLSLVKSNGGNVGEENYVVPFIQV